MAVADGSMGRRMDQRVADGSTFAAEGKPRRFGFFGFQVIEDITPGVTMQPGMVVEDDGGGKHNAVVFAYEHGKGPVIDTIFDSLFPFRTGVLVGDEFSVAYPQDGMSGNERMFKDYFRGDRGSLFRYGTVFYTDHDPESSIRPFDGKGLHQDASFEVRRRGRSGYKITGRPGLEEFFDRRLPGGDFTF